MLSCSGTDVDVIGGGVMTGLICQSCLAGLVRGSGGCKGTLPAMPSNFSFSKGEARTVGR